MIPIAGYKNFIRLLCLAAIWGNVTCDTLRTERREHKILDNQKEHYKNEEHNKEYDHEMFLGEEAKTFDQLTPEESRRRLSIIVDQMDTNHDGEITFEELKDRIKHMQRKYIVDDVDNQWRTHNLGENDKITWDAYIKTVYGFHSEHEADEVDNQEEVGGYSFRSLLNRDRRRWDAADEDGDKALSREEFTAFLHPEAVDHMKEIIVLETLEDTDKDKDGKISLAEYIGDIYQHDVDVEEELPEWARNEKEHFTAYRDKDGDGFMDLKEIRDWVLPDGFDHADAEARHLIYESDSDADQKLTKHEILEKYDLFVGSQATDFGEALTKHDEF